MGDKIQLLKANKTFWQFHVPQIMFRMLAKILRCNDMVEKITKLPDEQALCTIKWLTQPTMGCSSKFVLSRSVRWSNEINCKFHIENSIIHSTNVNAIYLHIIWPASKYKRRRNNILFFTKSFYLMHNMNLLLIFPFIFRDLQHFEEYWKHVLEFFWPFA